MSKIALIGATGFVGAAVLKEAVDRGHTVTAIARDPSKIKLTNDHVTGVAVDAMDTDALAAVLKGHDIVISAYNAGWTNPNIAEDFIKGSKSIQQAVRKSGVHRLFVIGGAGSLYKTPDLQWVDSVDFPTEYFVAASAARDYLNILKNENALDWTFLSPALEMHQGTSGERKGHYRTGLENPVFDQNNRSIISVEDMSIAIVDEAENPKHSRQRFTVAY